MTERAEFAIDHYFGGTHKVVTYDRYDGDTLLQRDVVMSTPREWPEVACDDDSWKCTGGKSHVRF